MRGLLDSPLYLIQGPGLSKDDEEYHPQQQEYNGQDPVEAQPAFTVAPALRVPGV